jgi:polar amino acid transport system substrate-binding protein
MGTGEFPPYISASYDEGGPITQIVNRSFANVGVQTRFHYLPWNRSYAMAKAAKFDATYPWSPDKQRRHDFFFSDPLYHFERRGFVLSESKLDVFKDEQIQMCQPIGYGRLGYEKVLFESKRAVLIEPPDMRQCFVMLKAKRVDLVVAEVQESNAYITEVFENNAEIKALEPVFYEYQNHLLVSKKHPKVKQILEQFNKGLKQLKQSGEYDRIIKASLIE